MSQLVSIEPASRQLFLQFCITALRRSADTNTERLALKPLKQLLQLDFAGLRQHHAALRGFAKMDLVHFAEFADAIHMAEEIDHVEFVARQGRKYRSPNSRGIFSADRFAIFRLQQ